MPRTSPCTAALRRGRLRKAGEFLEAAAQVADRALADGELANAYVTLCVLAGIAASDVICCARLGLYARGEDHNEAVALAGRADGAAAGHLRVLLGMKTKAEYSESGMTAVDAKRAGRAASSLVETARRVSAG